MKSFEFLNSSISFSQCSSAKRVKWWSCFLGWAARCTWKRWNCSRCSVGKLNTQGSQGWGRTRTQHRTLEQRQTVETVRQLAQTETYLDTRLLFGEGGQERERERRNVSSLSYENTWANRVKSRSSVKV